MINLINFVILVAQACDAAVSAHNRHYDDHMVAEWHLVEYGVYGDGFGYDFANMVLDHYESGCEAFEDAMNDLVDDGSFTVNPGIEF